MPQPPESATGREALQPLSNLEAIAVSIAVLNGVDPDPKTEHLAAILMAAALEVNRRAEHPERPPGDPEKVYPPSRRGRDSHTGKC